MTDIALVITNMLEQTTIFVLARLIEKKIVVAIRYM